MSRRSRLPEHLFWLKERGHSLAPLTGADFLALAAIDACWQLHPSADHPEQVRSAVRLLISQLQRKCWPLAKELIARAMEWEDRDRLWPLVTESTQDTAGQQAIPGLKILTSMRTNDWIAFVEGRPWIWEAAKTESEAAGRLLLRLQRAGDLSLTLKNDQT